MGEPMQQVRHKGTHRKVTDFRTCVVHALQEFFAELAIWVLHPVETSSLSSSPKFALQNCRILRVAPIGIKQLPLTWWVTCSASKLKSMSHCTAEWLEFQ